jgi:uncharacterized protein
MPSTLMTPGVYIEEKNAFPGSAVAVETAVPVFIGYTGKADRNGKSLVNKPTRITSFAEYSVYFGGAFRPKYTIADAPANTPDSEVFQLNKVSKTVTIKDDNTFYLYNSIRLFYANGGSACYILSVGTYEDQPAGFAMKKSDFIDALPLLEKEYEPTLVLMPDAIHIEDECYNSIYTEVLAHCAKMQSRFGILDLLKDSDTGPDGVAEKFRNDIGVNFLNYGAAYFPWLKTTIVDFSELDFENIDVADTAGLKGLLPEPAADAIIDKSVTDYTDVYKLAPGATTAAGKTLTEDDIKSIKKNLHQSLLAASPSYKAILEEIRTRINELPPSGAMAGIYTLVDTNRGVWKSPANVSLSAVSAPTVNITHDEQEKFNVDVMGGKSINVIRPFPGIGTLVWGGRTLDGNSQDWRYINVRRTLIMIEQSLKLATRAYVFEPNDGTTWSTINSMFTNFLTNLWKQGALAGAAPEQAFSVQVGLGLTMTPNDILDGIMKITVKLAIVRPAEFIVITFQQQQQQS